MRRNDGLTAEEEAKFIQHIEEVAKGCVTEEQVAARVLHAHRKEGLFKGKVFADIHEALTKATMGDGCAHLSGRRYEMMFGNEDELLPGEVLYQLYELAEHFSSLESYACAVFGAAIMFGHTGDISSTAMFNVVIRHAIRGHPKWGTAEYPDGTQEMEDFISRGMLPSGGTLERDGIKTVQELSKKAARAEHAIAKRDELRRQVDDLQEQVARLKAGAAAAAPPDLAVGHSDREIKKAFEQAFTRIDSIIKNPGLSKRIRIAVTPLIPGARP